MDELITISTSYYAQLPKLLKDENNICISISHSIPAYIDKSLLKIDKDFAPSWSILSEYKENPNEEVYIKRFKEEILSKIDLNKKISQWESLYPNKNIVLLCYDKVSDFCHRHIVGEALEKITKNPIKEKFFEDYQKEKYRVIVPIIPKNKSKVVAKKQD